MSDERSDGALPTPSELGALRVRMDGLNERILDLLQERARLALEIAGVKREFGPPRHDADREEQMHALLARRSEGPFGESDVRAIFAAIFEASLDLQQRRSRAGLRVSSRDLLPSGTVAVGRVLVGGDVPVLFAGPCAVESEEQMEQVASALAKVRTPLVLRAGAFKPRTSPRSFQGLREGGLPLLSAVARRHGLPTVTEVLDLRTLDVVADHADMLQVGARNMYNSELLKALGRVRKPVLLKRGFMATLEELLLAAEYVLSAGNDQVVLCERGIRTFEPSTRNTLDIAAVPLLRQQTRLPVIVDLSHSLGRRDIAVPCARAALAAGANGLMIEVHPAPESALCDGFQQLDLGGFAALVDALDLPVRTSGAPSQPR